MYVVFGDKIMMKYRRLPENISHLLPNVREYLNKHPKVVFAYLKQMGEFSSVTLEEYSRDWKVQRIVERTLRNNLNNFTVRGFRFFLFYGIDGEPQAYEKQSGDPLKL